MRDRRRPAAPAAFRAAPAAAGGGGAGLLRVRGSQGVPARLPATGPGAARPARLGGAFRLGARASERSALSAGALLADPYRPLERYPRPHRPPRLRLAPRPLSGLRLGGALALLLRL